MSYRCQKCKVVCQHGQIKFVAERYSNHDIKKELSLCEDCAVEMKINVPAHRQLVPNGVGLGGDEDSKSVLVGSA